MTAGPPTTHRLASTACWSYVFNASLSRSQAELRSAHEAARAVTAAATGSDDALDGGDSDVPEWKLREFADLRNAVASMWETLDIPPEDVTAFLSECDLLAPYHPKVLEMYQDMYRVRRVLPHPALAP